MPEKSKLDVSKWQAARPKWLYDPALWFFYRMIEVAYMDAKTMKAGMPADEAILARDWIACSEPAPMRAYMLGARKEFLSFPECCAVLGVNAEAERVALLAAIDKAIDTDTDEAWGRLDMLSAGELANDAEPLFDAPRVVPALDQMALF